jgi:hypothetical protein
MAQRFMTVADEEAKEASRSPGAGGSEPDRTYPGTSRGNCDEARVQQASGIVSDASRLRRPRKQRRPLICKKLKPTALSRRTQRTVLLQTSARLSRTARLRGAFQ